MKDIQEMEQLFKQYMGVLSEDFRHKLDLVIEGHELLHKEILEVREDVHDSRKEAQFMNDALSHKIDAVGSDLATHRKDTEAHGVKWSIREKDE